ncbi:MAG TPA: hypothetical protein VFN88_11390 [Caulobacteraceae bacterium]|nr:hypothetical protein [Caulobacteraceae bacterium]
MGYRFYPLNAHNRIFGVEIIEAPDDSEAARVAEKICRDRRLAGFELWDMARRITGQQAQA